MTLQSDVAFKCGSGCFILLNACCFDSSSLAPLPHLLLYREGGTALLNFILDPKCSSCGIMSAERNLPLRADTHDNGVSVQKEKKKERLDRPHFSLSKNPFFLSLTKHVQPSCGNHSTVLQQQTSPFSCVLTPVTIGYLGISSTYYFSPASINITLQDLLKTQRWKWSHAYWVMTLLSLSLVT